ncbi:MAG: GNAT family N-acetyltransferase [Thermoguttaceae bacterium]
MLRIREMNLDDVPLGCRLNDAAGWNQLPADWQRLLALEPTGCFVAEWHGQPVGTTCVTRFDTIAWISMVLVDAAHRGRGVGTQLMRHALGWLDQCGTRTVRLDATALGRPVYEKLGFVGEYEVARWEGAAVGGELRAEITVAADSHMKAIAALDRQATGTPRGPLLARLFAERPHGMRLAAAQGRITGFSVVRLGGRARQIGPVVALDISSGSGLLDAAFFDHQGQAVLLDVPLPNRPAVQWAETRGLCIQRQFLRMVRGRPVADRPEQIWAAFGPEKG